MDFDSNFDPPVINSTDVPSLDYLTCGNGPSLSAMHANKPTPPASPTDAAGTLESIVNQATRLRAQPQSATVGRPCSTEELVSWLQHHRDPATTMDALVPCNNIIHKNFLGNDLEDFVPTPSTRSASAGGRRLARVGMSNSSSNERPAFVGKERNHLAGGRTGYTSSSLVSQPNDFFGGEYTKTTGGDDHDSIGSRCISQSCETGQIGNEVGRKRIAKSSVSSKRLKATTNHNQSERKRRDRINQRIMTLQKMVPNFSKTDKASMLDEVIEYVKQLQAQVHIMNMSPMMLPLSAQQQLQMTMMAGMRMGMGVMDINNIDRATTGVSPVIPSAATVGGGFPAPRPPGSVVPNHFASISRLPIFQPMNMDTE